MSKTESPAAIGWIAEWRWLNGCVLLVAEYLIIASWLADRRACLLDEQGYMEAVKCVTLC